MPTLLNNLHRCSLIQVIAPSPHPAGVLPNDQNPPMLRARPLTRCPHTTVVQRRTRCTLVTAEIHLEQQLLVSARFIIARCPPPTRSGLHLPRLYSTPSLSFLVLSSLLAEIHLAQQLLTTTEQLAPHAATCRAVTRAPAAPHGCLFYVPLAAYAGGRCTFAPSGFRAHHRRAPSTSNLRRTHLPGLYSFSESLHFSYAAKLRLFQSKILFTKILHLELLSLTNSTLFATC
jgi:hypothetical protein